jgi:hypothetical protein
MMGREQKAFDFVCSGKIVFGQITDEEVGIDDGDHGRSRPLARLSPDRGPGCFPGAVGIGMSGPPLGDTHAIGLILCFKDDAVSVHKEYQTGPVIILDIPGYRGMLKKLIGFGRSCLKIRLRKSSEIPGCTREEHYGDCKGTKRESVPWGCIQGVGKH